MSARGRWWRRSLPYHATGVALLAIGILVMHYLFATPHAGQDATLGEMGLAAIGFLACSLGTALALLGGHIHDEVRIAERWRRG